MIFGRKLDEDTLVELEISLKNIAQTYRKRALEHKNNYEKIKRELLSEISRGDSLDSPALLAKAKRALYYHKQALAFYNDYNNLTLLVEEIKNIRIRKEAMEQLKEEKLIDTLKGKLSPALRSMVKDARSLSELVNKIMMYSSEMRVEGPTTDISDEEAREFLQALASEASQVSAKETTTTAAGERLKRKLEELERQLESIE